MTTKELRRMRHLLEKESRTPENVQKQIDKSETLVRADEIAMWKNFASTMLNRDETLANKIGLAMSIMSELIKMTKTQKSHRNQMGLILLNKNINREFTRVLCYFYVI